jgi:hypothetical protein
LAEHALGTDAGRHLRFLTNNLRVASFSSGRDLDVSVISGRLDTRYAAVLADGVPPGGADWCKRATPVSHIAFFRDIDVLFRTFTGDTRPLYENQPERTRARGCECHVNTVHRLGVENLQLVVSRERFLNPFGAMAIFAGDRQPNRRFSAKARPARFIKQGPPTVVTKRRLRKRLRFSGATQKQQKSLYRSRH